MAKSIINFRSYYLLPVLVSICFSLSIGMFIATRYVAIKNLQLEHDIPDGFTEESDVVAAVEVSSNFPRQQEFVSDRVGAGSVNYSLYRVVGLVLIVLIGALSLALLSCVRYCRMRKKSGREDNGNSEDHREITPGDATSTPQIPPSSSTAVNVTARSSQMVGGPSDHVPRYPYADIQIATDNFNEQRIVGRGGCGVVYRGTMGTYEVAVKRSTNPGQSKKEFRTEIDLLSTIRHRNVVALMGYCEENGEVILVYEYVPLGTLRSHLYGEGKLPMPWSRRLSICLEVARGLHHLHTGAKDLVIHRDIKTDNILLTESWEAKIADFGISKKWHKDEKPVTAFPKGTIGYWDLQYVLYNKLSEKCDVFSFGVVLLEVFSARPALNNDLPSGQILLSKWAQECYKTDTFNQIIDHHLIGKIAPECLEKFSNIAMRCIAENQAARPSMDTVIAHLVEALMLQEMYEKGQSSQ